MHRAAICLAVLALGGVQPLAGQEERMPAHVYEAYYRISQADMDDWNRQYWEYSVPILEGLQEKGVIQGWSHWQHHTGGEYNVRFAVRAYDWAAFDTFWEEYLSGMQAAMPEEEWERGARLIVEHRDEIWDIGGSRVSEEMADDYIYASTFRINFADMAEWNRMWTDMVFPFLNQAVEDGRLAGWVKLNHNTGGPHNSKVLYWFDSWDDIDDLFQGLFSTMEEEHAEAWERLAALFQAHDDVIWVSTRREEM